MLRTVTLTSLLFALTALAGCRSDEPKTTTDFQFDCICGSPEAAMTECLHPVCMNGMTNPENPDCVCGEMSFDEQ